MDPPFFLALPPYSLILSTHIGYPKIPPVKYPATSSEVDPQEDSSETVDVMPPDPSNEEHLAATSQKPKRGSPDEISMLPDTPLNDQRNFPFTRPPQGPTDKEGVEPLDGVIVFPASALKVHPNCQLQGLKQQQLKNQTWNLLIDFQCSLLYLIR